MPTAMQQLSHPTGTVDALTRIPRRTRRLQNVSTPGSPRVFISYRRSDNIDLVGRIYDRLAYEFGPVNVFHDLSTLTPGSEFRREIATAIDQSTAVLVVIGPHWDVRRLADPRDLVRIEIEEALRQRILVIPVLLGTAGFPPDDHLPGSVRPLLNRHALRLRPDDFHRSIEPLVDVLRGHHGGVPVEQTPTRSAAGDGHGTRTRHPRPQGTESRPVDARDRTPSRARSTGSKGWAVAAIVATAAAVAFVVWSVFKLPLLPMAAAALLISAIGAGLVFRR